MNFRYILSATLLILGAYAIVEGGAPLLGAALIGIGLFVIIWAIIKIGVMLAILAGIIYLVHRMGGFETIQEFMRAMGAM